MKLFRFSLFFALAVAVVLSGPLQSGDNEPKRYKLVSSSYEDCGASSDPLHMTGVSISPDTIVIPGNITISGSVSNTEQIAAPIKAVVDMQFHYGLWITIPCEDNVGSCTYDDICSPVAGVDLCPVPVGSISVSNYQVALPAVSDSPIDGGEVKINAVLSQNGTELGCVNVVVSFSIIEESL